MVGSRGWWGSRLGSGRLGVVGFKGIGVVEVKWVWGGRVNGWG